ncbi:MAG: DUF2752 domain-containing protein [Lachnospiraceae bacterium]|jgi:hypothetical protein|nr:DUF2752 domain-containing protein [Lachnospiraceae bacterium]
MEYREKERRSLYVIGLVMLVCIVVYIILNRVIGIKLEGVLPPCLFHELTGLYCPGCGGTRAFRLLLEGKVWASLYYHPLVLFGGILYVWFMVSNTIEYASRGKFQVGMRYRSWYVKAGVIILAVNFCIKNGAVLFAHYSMIA